MSRKLVRMKIRLSRRDILFNIFLYSFFIVFNVSILIPFLHLITFSISSEAAISRPGYRLLPIEFFTENWRTVATSPRIWTAFYNTVFVTLSAVLYQLFLSTTYAYSLSQRHLPNRKFWTIILLITMFFGGGLIPTFMLYRQLGLIDNRLALIVGGVAAWYVLIIRNFFMAIPGEILDSARIDGANEVNCFATIMLPLSKPVLATITLWLLVGNWNSWFACMIYINDPNKIVLQVVLRQIIIENSINLTDIAASLKRIEDAIKNGRKYVTASAEGLKSAALLFVTLPILITYPFLQKYLIKGILIGSLKG
jgi:putative aldouronate transport system permease protein